MRTQKTSTALGGVALALATWLPVGSSRAEVTLGGFVEAGYGVRTATAPAFTDTRDYTLEETRSQLRASAYGDGGEVFVRLDFVHDQIGDGDTNLELREGFLRFSALGDALDVKAGRQALTWGTGDLIFINDLFPKDWVSFFVGREDQYLKAPADAVRLGLFALPVDVELVLIPEFTPDRVPSGERLTFYSPLTEPVSPMEPANVFENGELATRVSTYVGNWSVALYGYRGFFKSPQGLMMADTVMTPFHPALSVYGASVRGGFMGGVLWAETGYHDSRQDRNGTDPLIPNSSLRSLAGFERQMASDLTVGIQYYTEWMQDFDAHEAALPAGAPTGDELRQLATLRVEKMLDYQTIRLSFFAFVSPTDEDGYIRALASYKLTDEVEATVGTNLFAGNEGTTMFGQFDKNDNAFVRVRYSF